MFLIVWIVLKMFESIVWFFGCCLSFRRFWLSWLRFSWFLIRNLVIILLMLFIVYFVLDV